MRFEAAAEGFAVARAVTLPVRACHCYCQVGWRWQSDEVRLTMLEALVPEYLQ